MLSNQSKYAIRSVLYLAIHASRNNKIGSAEVGEKTKSTELTLQALKKGIHRLQGKIIDEAGQTISVTDEVTFQFRKPADLTKIAPNLVPPAQ